MILCESYNRWYKKRNGIIEKVILDTGYKIE